MKDRFKCNDCGTEFSKSQEAEKCCRGDYTDIILSVKLKITIEKRCTWKKSK